MRHATEGLTDEQMELVKVDQLLGSLDAVIYHYEDKMNVYLDDGKLKAYHLMKDLEEALCEAYGLDY